MAQLTIPEHLKALIPLAKQIGKDSVGGITGGAQPPHISIRGNRFSTVDSQGNITPLKELEISVIIVGANPHKSKMFFDRPYDPSDTNPAPPACWSDNGVGPSDQSMEPQHANCAGCRHNVRGSAVSAISGKMIKACTDRKKLAVLYEGNLYMLVIPPASLTVYRDYHNTVDNIPNLGVAMLRTIIGFDPKVTGVLTFTAEEMLDEDDAKVVQKVLSNPAMLAPLTGVNDKPIEPQLVVQVVPKGGLPSVAEMNKVTTGPAAVARMNQQAETLKPVEDRIVTLRPEKPVTPSPSEVPLSEQAMPRKRTRRTLPLEEATPQAAKPSFGMMESAPTEGALRDMLSNALKFKA
jgi:hypothetical protein